MANYQFKIRYNVPGMSASGERCCWINAFSENDAIARIKAKARRDLAKACGFDVQGINIESAELVQAVED